jgi:hypothetical protein
MFAIKRNDSLFGSLLILIAGIIAPKRFPKCGVPVLCTPVSILAIIFPAKAGIFFN